MVQQVVALVGGLGGLFLANATGCGGKVIEIPADSTGTSTAPPANRPPMANAPSNVVANVMANAPSTNAPATNAMPVNLPSNVMPVNAPATNAMPVNVATNVVANLPSNVGITGLVTNAPATNLPIPVGANYIDDGIIHGYCFGFQIVGSVTTECAVENGLCCPYTLPGTSWEDIAMIGCNVNQPIDGGDGSQLTWVPDGTAGICIEGRGFERIQIQGPTGAANPNDRWCAAVPFTGGCVEWQEFNTTCWDNAGNYYRGEPLEVVAALQPSKSDGIDVAVTPITDTLCVTSIQIME
jgi:hypothetical protein